MSIAVLNTDSGLSATTLLNSESAQNVTGLKSFNRSPSAPFAVQSGSAVVPNLIAESLSGGTVSGTTLTLSGNVLSDLKFTDATYDIGKSAATRPRDGFFSRNVTIGGTLTVSGIGVTIFTGLSNGTIAGGVTTYFGATYSSVTETIVKFPCPVAGTIKNLYVSADGAISGANTVTFTARLAAVDQTVTCQVTAGAATANDTTHSFAVTAGQLLSIKCVASAVAETRSWTISYQLVTT